ncbi:hypothetical protein [Cryobacterium flavum]|nr:hypothetical protein [Cryobacterium flavum]
MDDMFKSIDKIDDDDLDAPLAIRLLDWIGFLKLGLHLDGNKDDLHAVVTRLIGCAATSERDGLWMSLEGTTSVVLGVVAAVTARPDAIELLDRTAKGLMALRQEYAQNRSNPSETDVITRVSHALSIAEQVAPLVIDRIAEAVPRSTYARSRPDSPETQEQSGRQADILSVRNREVNAALVQSRQSLAARAPIWILGALFVWVLVCGTMIWLGFLAGQIWRWPTLAPFLTAPVAFIWFWLATRVIWAMERFEIVPRWLSRLSRAFPKFTARAKSVTTIAANDGTPGRLPR